MYSSKQPHRVRGTRLEQVRDKEIYEGGEKVEYSKEIQQKLKSWKHLFATAKELRRQGKDRQLSETYEKITALSKDLAINYGAFFAPDHDNIITYLPHNAASMVEFKRVVRWLVGISQNTVQMWDLIRTYFVQFQASLAKDAAVQANAIMRLETLQRDPTIAIAVRVTPGPDHDHLLKIFAILHDTVKAFCASPKTADEIEADQSCAQYIKEILPIVQPDPLPALEMPNAANQALRSEIDQLDNMTVRFSTRLAELQADAEAVQPQQEDLLKTLEEKMSKLTLLIQTNDQKAQGLRAQLQQQVTYTPAGDAAESEEKLVQFADRCVLLLQNDHTRKAPRNR